jgi:hypothetical protein
LQEITHLNDLFGPGEIHPKGYRSERKEMVERAKELTGQLGGLTSED